MLYTCGGLCPCAAVFLPGLAIVHHKLEATPGLQQNEAEPIPEIRSKTAIENAGIDRCRSGVSIRAGERPGAGSVLGQRAAPGLNHPERWA